MRQFIRDNALMWVEEYHVDGLRMDMTLYVRSVRADGEPNLPDGWSLLQWVNGEIREKHPNTLTIAEDLQKSEWLTKTVGGGRGRIRQPVGRPVRPPDSGGGHHPRRRPPQHGERWRQAIAHKYNGDAFQRVIYSESHDEVANGRARVVHEIAPGRPERTTSPRSGAPWRRPWCSPRRESPCCSMGQEFLEGGWFRDTVPVDWDHRSRSSSGIVKHCTAT